MDGSRASYRRAALIGVGLSVLLHAAAFALLKFDIVADRPVDQTIALMAAAEDEPTRPVAKALDLEPAITDATDAVPFLADPAAEGVAASSTSAPAVMSPTAIPVSSEPLLAARPDDERSYEPLVFTDPVLEQVKSVDFTELAAAETEEVTGNETYPLYEPGTVGKAKRKWADTGAGTGRTGEGVGIGFGIGAGRGGHCPMPGQGGFGGSWPGGG
jgi:hypothetical protein